MAVKIRLSRIGKKKVPFYRIVAVDSRKKRDGAFLDDLGTYDALNTKLVHFHEERIMDWVSKGAQMTPTVKRLLKLHKKGTQVAKPAKKQVKKQAKTAMPEKEEPKAAPKELEAKA